MNVMLTRFFAWVRSSGHSSWAKVGSIASPSTLGRRSSVDAERRNLCDAVRECPHRSGPLSDGLLLPMTGITCPLHGYSFDLRDGRALRGSSVRLLVDLSRVCVDCPSAS